MPTAAMSYPITLPFAAADAVISAPRSTPLAFLRLLYLSFNASDLFFHVYDWWCGLLLPSWDGPHQAVFSVA
jgi:hypothetical protein